MWFSVHVEEVSKSSILQVGEGKVTEGEGRFPPFTQTGTDTRKIACQFLKNVNIYLPYATSKCAPGHLWPRNENISTKTCNDVHGDFMCNSPRLETVLQQVNG